MHETKIMKIKMKTKKVIESPTFSFSIHPLHLDVSHNMDEILATLLLHLKG